MSSKNKWYWQQYEDELDTAWNNEAHYPRPTPVPDSRLNNDSQPVPLPDSRLNNDPQPAPPSKPGLNNDPQPAPASQPTELPDQTLILNMCAKPNYSCITYVGNDEYGNEKDVFFCKTTESDDYGGLSEDLSTHLKNFKGTPIPEEMNCASLEPMRDVFFKMYKSHDDAEYVLENFQLCTNSAVKFQNDIKFKTTDNTCKAFQPDNPGAGLSNYCTSSKESKGCKGWEDYCDTSFGSDVSWKTVYPEKEDKAAFENCKNLRYSKTYESGTSWAWCETETHCK